MSTTQEHTVWCDGRTEGDHACGQWDQASGSLREVLREVQRSGWQRVRDPSGKMIDLCPACAKAWSARKAAS